MPEDEMVGWHHQLNGHDMGFGELRELVMDREPDILRFMGSQIVRYD